MRNLLRKPLVWMILAECAVVTILILVAWHWIAAGFAAAAGPTAISAPAAAPDASPATSPPVAPKPPKLARQLPGLNVDTDFWRTMLAGLNRDQAAFEVLEWRIVHSAMDAIQRYTESVVLPSVEQAERGG
jgi:hypothetical protein